MLEALYTVHPSLISDHMPCKDLERQQAGWDLPLDRPDRFLAALTAVVGMDQDHPGSYSNGDLCSATRGLTGRYRSLFGC
jgi:hypothetical protein